MKTAFVFLAIVAFAAADIVETETLASGRSLSSAVVDGIEGMKEQMPCGFPEMGVPILAPYKLSHREINIDTPNFRINGNIDNLVVKGLDNFETPVMKFGLGKVTFRFDFHEIQLQTQYNLAIMVKKAGFTINLVGAGPAEIVFKDLSISGDIRYVLNIFSKKVKVKSLEVRPYIGEVHSHIEGILGEGAINKKLNSVLAEAFETSINENDQLIATTIENMVLPKVNGVLSQKSLPELIASIGGGDDTEKVVCNPEAQA